MDQPFVHLHLHTEYSLLDGAIRIEPLMDRVAALGMPCVAMTDHGNLFGAIKFHDAARQRGIKPIIGAEIYLAKGSRFDRKTPEGGGILYHLTLLAKDLTGYRNLIRLVTAAHLESFYYKPRIDKELLAKHAEGLIALSGCSLKGEIPTLLIDGSMEKAVATTDWYREIFGPDNFYLEIQRTGVEGLDEINRELVSLSRETGIPLVATNDCHYLEEGDQTVHDVLLCIQTGKKLDDEDRLRFSSDQFYVKSSEEMAALFSDIPDAYINTRKIAQQCDLTLESSAPRLPVYSVPGDSSPHAFLTEIAQKGLTEKLKEIEPAVSADDYQKRLGYELEVIGKTGYADYFLIVWDYIRFAKEAGIPVGPGRGSAAGSLVAYAVGITDIDPLRYDLLFERFLNPERVSLPDIDVDFCKIKRDGVIDYIRKKYGDDKVSNISTFGTLQPRAVIRDVGRVMGLPYSTVDQLAKMVPPNLPKDVPFKKFLADTKEFDEIVAQNPDLEKLLDIAVKLEGMPRHASTHAAGVIIAPSALTDYAPLFRTKDRVVCSQYDMKDLESVGLVKFDLLGLKTLTVIDDAKRLIDNRREKEAKILLEELVPGKFPLDDPETFRVLQEGETTGVFQLENPGMKDLLIQMKPKSFDDLIAVLALYRPGPLESGVVDQYIKRRKKRESVTYDFPELEKILEGTFGLPIYQEQIMQITMTLAGFTAGEADILRYAMGKKKEDVMESLRERFLEGAKAAGHKNRDKMDSYFSTLSSFSSYGFNKSHSAAYAMISYQTAMLKAHYPAEFMAALLTSEMDNTDKMVRMIQECRQMEIPVLPPDVNHSERTFTISDGGIRFGLQGIKNVGGGAIESILEARMEGGHFSNLLDFCERIDLRRVNRRVMEGLIKSGAFDCFGKKRAQLVAVLDQAMELGQKWRRDQENGQISIFQTLELADQPTPDIEYPDCEEWPEHRILSYEKEALGFYVSGNPLANYESIISNLTRTTTADAPQWQDGQTVVLAGLLDQIEKRLTRKQEPMAKGIVEDQYGQVEILVFPKIFEKAAPLLGTSAPILIEGRVDIKGKAPVIIVDEISRLEDAGRKKPREVHLYLRGPGLTDQDLLDLRELLTHHQGDLPVYLHLFLTDLAGEVILDTTRSFWVDPDDGFAERVEERFGHGSVQLE